MNLVMKSKFGSHLYGTDTPESDLDYKGIYIPSARSILLGTDKGQILNNTSDNLQKNTADDIDEELFSLKQFINMAIKGETITLDMIHTPDNMIVEMSIPEIWNFIRENRSKFYTTDMKAYLGYVRKQASKYGIKGSRIAALRKALDWVNTLPESKEISVYENQRVKHVEMVDGKFHTDTKIGEFFNTAPLIPGHAEMVQVDGNNFYRVLTASYQDTLSVKRLKLSLRKQWEGYGERARKAEQNEGIDWKALHHACRAGLQLQEIYVNGDLQYPLGNADYLLKIKTGQVQFKEVSEYLEHIVQIVEVQSENARKNGMPQQVDRKFWDDFVYDTYYTQVNKG